jgi:hypothetical protein
VRGYSSLDFGCRRRNRRFGDRRNRRLGLHWRRGHGRLRLNFTRGRLNRRRLLLHPRQRRQQHGRRIHADALERDAAAFDRAARLARGMCRACKRHDIERGERGVAAEHLLGGGRGIEQRAIGQEHGDGMVDIRQQALRLVAERKLGAGGFRRHHEDRRRAVGQHDPCAVAKECAAEPAAEAAQPFQPWSCAVRQGSGKPRDLQRGGTLGIDHVAGEGGRRAGVEDRGRGRIAPQNAGCVRAPQPHRHGARGVQRKPRVA